MSVLYEPAQRGSESTPRRLPAFDVLRAAAATLVFLFHYAGFVQPYSIGNPLVDATEWLMSQMGAIGTNILLLLSGYFIAKSTSSGRFSYKRFVALRFLRIYIPYVLVLLMAIGFARVLPQFSKPEATGATLSYFASQLLLLPGLFPDSPLLSVAWTLSYIIAGYLIFPILALQLRRWQVRRSRRLLIWAVVTAVIFTIGLTNGVLSIRFSYVPAGCLVYEAQAEPEESLRPDGMMRSLFALTFLSLLIRVWLSGYLGGADSPATFIRAIFVISGLVLVSTLIGIALLIQRRYISEKQGKLVPLLAGYGRTGYSFYLMHGPVVKFFALLVFPALAAWQAPAALYWLVLPLCWAVAAAAAMVLYHLVERPSRKFLMNEWPPAPHRQSQELQAAGVSGASTTLVE